MEVTALCTGLLTYTWLLLATQIQDRYYAQMVYTDIPHVVPPRLQHFEYESISFKCDGSDGRRWVMRKTLRENTACGKTWGTLNGSFCVIRDVYADDSGEYWCETGDETKRSVVRIAVTAGSVILETPVLPVMEGESLTLRCRNKTASSVSASFFKNGVLIKNVSTANLVIRSVSKCDEGLYRCAVSGDGESPESWLGVREFQRESDQLPVLFYFLIKTSATLLCVALLLVVLRKLDSRQRDD